MEFGDFLEYCHACDFNIVIFSTSLVGKNGEMWCHIVVSQNGDSGNFARGDGYIDCLGEILDDVSKTIENLKRYG